MRKSIAIFGEGLTEWCYIDSLRIAGRYPFKMRCLFLNLVDSFLISFPSQVDIFLMVVDTFLNSWSVSYSTGHFPKYIDVVLTV